MKKSDIHRQRVRISREGGCRKVRIVVTPNETNDPVNLKFTLISKDGSSVAVHGKYYIEEASGTQREWVNVLNDYHALYAAEEAQRTAAAVDELTPITND